MSQHPHHPADKSVETLRHERDRFVAFAFASADILVELDESANILFIDGAIGGLLGREADACLNTPFLGLVHEKDADAAQELLATALKEDRIEQITIHLAAKFGDPIPFSMSGYKLKALRNHYYLTLSLLKNMISAEELHRRDSETGLFNRESFAEMASRRIQEARERGKTLKITLLDLPELQTLLGNLTHDTMRQLLGDISMYLRNASLGGDSAGMVSKDPGAYSLILDDEVEPDQVVEQVFEITRRVDPEGHGVPGQSHTIDADAPSLTGQDCANALLYTINLFANTQGDEFNIRSLSGGYQAMLKETVQKISEFKSTVDAGKFELAFQPIVELRTGVTHHYEVLVRIEGQNFDDPYKFISFGEKTGIIGEFDLAMCQRTIDVLLEARERKHYPKVAVNLSGRSLSSSLYLDALKEIAYRHSSLYKQLIFEITESAKITNLQTANNFIQEMREKGFLFCLDDFGVGESSFDYLRNLHIDFVKIDGSYVRESMATKRGQHLLKAMSGMCKELGIVTIGEMVEDEKVAALLWESGVKFGQGFLFGKPVMDSATLINCSQPNPYYHGVLRAKSFASKATSRQKPDS